MITKESTVIRNNEVFASEIDNEVVMMHIQTGKYYGLDDIGSRIWEMMEAKIRVEDLIQQLLEEYEVSEEECTRDVLELLENLQTNDLILVA
jgi:hypothetical protein